MERTHIDHPQTVTTISHFLLGMMAHPDVLEKAQKEIDTVVGSDRLPTFEDRSRLPYGGFLAH